MLIYQGKSVCKGIAIGKIKIFKKENAVLKCYHVDDIKAEYSRFMAAKEKAHLQLEELYKKALLEAGEEAASIFEIHIMMLEDDEFIASVKELIETKSINAEYAVSTSSDKFAAIFSSMDDPYMCARAADVKDISERIINILSGNNSNILSCEEAVILCAEDFSPSETIQLDKSKILAFITSKGSLNSHTSILARTMNIPAIIGIDIYSDDYLDNKPVVVDGYTGMVYVDPDEDFLKKSKQQQDNENKQKELLTALKGKDSVTLDGKEIKLYANIGNIKDLPNVIENDAAGIGLFRSEFIYLEKNTFPSEEEQFAIYKNAVETMKGKNVIIRTLDIGADKQVDYFKLDEEDNPALGVRAIRLCLKRPDIFKTQIRALLRASVYGNLSIMYPMITSLQEISDIKNLVAQTANELESQKIPYMIPPQGIMIETPAAAIISDLLAKEVDFFSIGTNDLSQYVMAIDRQNEQLDEFFQPHHEAVLRLIELTTKNAHKEDIWVGICGELAADSSLTEKFLQIGIDELSVSPSYVLPIRKRIREINLSKKSDRN